jgi:hypothetical protein
MLFSNFSQACVWQRVLGRGGGGGGGGEGVRQAQPWDREPPAAPQRRSAMVRRWCEEGAVGLGGESNSGDGRVY